MIIEINGRTIEPPGWNDLERELLMNCYTMLGLPAMRGVDSEVSWKRLVQACWICDIDQAFLTRWRDDCMGARGAAEGEEVFLQEQTALVEAATALMWDRVEGDTERWSVSLTLTRCPWPEIQVQGHTYYAPAEAWENITYWEFTMLWEHLNAFLDSGDHALMDYILGILYRPSKEATDENIASGYEGDRRLPLRRHETTIQSRADLWSTVPGVVKQLLLFWAICCRQAIYLEYSDIFGVGGDSEADYTGPVESGLADIMLDLAGSVADIDRVADQNVHNVMRWLRRQQELNTKET